MTRIRIRDFDSRLVLEAPVNTQDDTGGIERSWVFVKKSIKATAGS